MLRTLVRRSYNAPLASQAPFKPYANPYKAKKQWPPDFTKLSNQHQFRLERRYRRRSKLKWARPRWNKFIKLVTWGTIIFVGFYGVLFMEVGDEGSPFDGIRAWYSRVTGSIWTNRSRETSKTASAKDDQSPVTQIG